MYFGFRTVYDSETDTAFCRYFARTQRIGSRSLYRGCFARVKCRFVTVHYAENRKNRSGPRRSCVPKRRRKRTAARSGGKEGSARGLPASVIRSATPSWSRRPGSNDDRLRYTRLNVYDRHSALSPCSPQMSLRRFRETITRMARPGLKLPRRTPNRFLFASACPTENDIFSEGLRKKRSVKSISAISPPPVAPRSVDRDGLRRPHFFPPLSLPVSQKLCSPPKRKPFYPL